MKKLYNIFNEKTYSSLKFERAMNRVKLFAFIIGMLFFALIAFNCAKESNIAFYNKINPVATFLHNHGIDLDVILSDVSPYIVGLFLFVLMPLIMWLNHKYRRSIQYEYIIKTAAKLSEKDKEINEQKAANKILRESNMKRFEENIELKKSFEDAVAEIKLLKASNQDNLKQIAYLKAVKNHKKRPVFEPEVKEWECVNPEYWPKFHVGRKYKNAITVPVDFDKATTLCLLSENGIACLVEKQYFIPVK